ncbi:MAG: long-chain fatty acid--CoA ligase [Bacteroidales bacterium]|nr:long-chain fatty acid--CoA ligase [Bacteroidales bacterium]MDE6236276.1 AMP-binding protein [Muribaculaceae bacterium]
MKDKKRNDDVSSLNAIIKESIKKNWDRMAFSDMGGINYQYKDVAEQIAKLHIMFDAAGVKKGDRVAICGKNSSNWAVIFLSCITAGVVAVPILHEFKPDTVHHLVNHCGAKLLFVDAGIWENLDEKNLPELEAVLFISEFGMPYSKNKKLTETRNNINECFGKKYPYSFTKESLEYFEDKPEDLALINYTAGSTGMSKGVELPFRSIWSNIRFCVDNLDWFKAGDGIVNMLPLAHLYGMTVEMLHPICKGCHCYFLTKLPSPKIILGAFAEVHPKLIVTVPLIIEKIIRNKVFPQLEKPLTKFLLKLPGLEKYILKKVRAQLMQAFGGNLHEVIVGGAPLNADVEKFLQKIDFPLTVGYGMTECGPLISYAPSNETRPHSVGKIVDRMEIRIMSDDPETIPGNIQVRGMNVMQGYYKNPKATEEVMGKDGWMDTGDRGIIDKDGFIYIMGRSKTMILGPSGQNIYPEEIEAKLNNLPYVNESLIIEKDGQIVALIHPDFDAALKDGKDREKLEKVMQQNIELLNKDIPAYSKVKDFKIFDEEFEKTPKRSIKRFLYS